MKFAIAALLLANTQAVKIGDDCGGKWCNKGLAYDYNEADLNKAKADNVAKTHHFNGSTISDTHAKDAAAAAGAAASAASAANAAAGAATAEFAGTSYKDKAAFAKAEAANKAAVKAKEAALDASLKADDSKVEADLISARKGRDLASSTASKARSDANLKANQERFAWESDQLERGQNQDRLKHVNENTVAKTSEIQDKHDQREGANGRLLKAIASF